MHIEKSRNRNLHREAACGYSEVDDRRSDVKEALTELKIPGIVCLFGLENMQR